MPPQQHSEGSRLETVRKYKILDTPSESLFDDMTWLAAKLYQAPMAVLVFTDASRHWFKAKCGLTVSEIRRNAQLLARTLAQHDPFIVLDAAGDKELTSDPLVAGEPNVRFYVGAPLLTVEEVPLGVLAVMDSSPRGQVTDEQKRVLEILARQVVTELEHRYSTAEQREKDEERFRFIAEGVEDLISVLDTEGKRLYNNQSYRELFGDPEPRGTDPFSQIHPDDRARMCELFERTVKTGRGDRADFRFVLADGSIRYMESQGTPILDAYGKVTQVVLVTRDMTKRKKVEEAHQRHNLELEQRYSEISSLNAMGNLLHRCDTKDDIKKAFLQYERKLFATSSGAIYLFDPPMKQFAEFLTWGDPSPCEPFFSKDRCWAVKGGGGMHVVEDPDPNKALLCKHLSDVRSPHACIHMTGKGDTNLVLHLQLSPNRNESLHQEEQRRWMRAQQEVATAVARHFALAIDNLGQREYLQRAADEDKLTGLYNRHYMEATLQREVLRSARNQRMLGVIMIDIDHFKEINDRHTHLGGDYVLRQVGRFLRTHVRETDVACRFGGEEFMLIMPETSHDGLRERAEQLRQGVKTLNLGYSGQPLRITLSLGVAFLTGDGTKVDVLRRAADETAVLAKEKVEELKRAADEALYQAKKEGRDRVVIWDEKSSGQFVH